jgi:hypothetical protein
MADGIWPAVAIESENPLLRTIVGELRIAHGEVTIHVPFAPREEFLPRAALEASRLLRIHHRDTEDTEGDGEFFKEVSVPLCVLCVSVVNGPLQPRAKERLIHHRDGFAAITRQGQVWPVYGTHVPPLLYQTQ